MDARPLSRRGGDHVRSEVTGPGGEVTECVVKDNADGTYAVEYTPYEKGQSPHRTTLPLMRVPRFSILIYSLCLHGCVCVCVRFNEGGGGLVRFNVCVCVLM